MTKNKGNGFIYLIFGIMVLFFIIPSIYVCYVENYKRAENLEINSIIDLCNKTLFPEGQSAYSWILTTPGIMMILGIISLIVSIILYDLHNPELRRLDIYKKKGIY